MGMAGSFFELHPSNLMRNHISHICETAEILDLAISVWSVLSCLKMSLEYVSKNDRYISSNNARHTFEVKCVNVFSQLMIAKHASLALIL